MLSVFDPLRDLTIRSLIFRLVMAMCFGGVIGLERGLRGRAAGLRTYMLVCIGAALSVMLSEYEYWLLETSWADAADAGMKIDVSRYGAQVINGIGFLGAGTIIVTEHHEIRGLTTAAGLWASGCLGLAIGAGFYECAIAGFGFVLITSVMLHRFSERLAFNSRSMSIYVEYRNLSDVRLIVRKCRELGTKVNEVELTQGHRRRKGQDTGMVLFLELAPHTDHTAILASLSELDCVRLIDEI